jgi:hypothetical protein
VVLRFGRQCIVSREARSGVGKEAATDTANSAKWVMCRSRSCGLPRSPDILLVCRSWLLSRWRKVRTDCEKFLAMSCLAPPSRLRKIARVAQRLGEQSHQPQDALARRGVQVYNGIENYILPHRAAQQSRQSLLQARSGDPDRKPLMVMGRSQRSTRNAAIDQTYMAEHLKAAERAGSKAGECSPANNRQAVIGEPALGYDQLGWATIRDVCDVEFTNPARPARRKDFAAGVIRGEGGGQPVGQPPEIRFKEVWLQTGPVNAGFEFSEIAQAGEPKPVKRHAGGRRCRVIAISCRPVRSHSVGDQAWGPQQRSPNLPSILVTSLPSPARDGLGGTRCGSRRP